MCLNRCGSKHRGSTRRSHPQAADLAKWRNRYTRDAQNVVPARACEFDSRLGYYNIAGATGVQSAFMRLMCSARYRDLQLETMRVGQCSFGSHKPELSGATPRPATYAAASRKCPRLICACVSKSVVDTVGLILRGNPSSGATRSLNSKCALPPFVKLLRAL